MAKWENKIKWYYYTDKNGGRRGVTAEQLVGLAKDGKITPDTIIETDNGKKAPAGKVKGLTFPSVGQPETKKSELHSPVHSKDSKMYYYFDNGGLIQGAITLEQLKELARQGTIKPKTTIRYDAGKFVLAETMEGLVFGAAQPKPVMQPPIRKPLPSKTERREPSEVIVSKVKRTIPQNTMANNNGGGFTALVIGGFFGIFLICAVVGIMRYIDERAQARHEALIAASIDEAKQEYRELGDAIERARQDRRFDNAIIVRARQAHIEFGNAIAKAEQEQEIIDDATIAEVKQVQNAITAEHQRIANNVRIAQQDIADAQRRQRELEQHLETLERQQTARRTAFVRAYDDIWVSGSVGQMGSEALVVKSAVIDRLDAIAGGHTVRYVEVRGGMDYQRYTWRLENMTISVEFDVDHGNVLVLRKSKSGF